MRSVSIRRTAGLAGLCPRHGQRRLLPRRGADAELAYRPVSLREQPIRRFIPRRDRRAAAQWCVVVRNGIAESEFEPVTATPDATDSSVSASLRPVKAIDVLIEALGVLKGSGRIVKPRRSRAKDRMDPKLHAQANRLGLADQIPFIGHCPGRAPAFTDGRIFVIPSRAESLPYVVLRPQPPDCRSSATNVGGMVGILGPQSAQLIPATISGRWPGPSRRRSTIPSECTGSPQALRTRGAQRILGKHHGRGNLAAYREAIASQKAAQFA